MPNKINFNIGKANDKWLNFNTRKLIGLSKQPCLKKEDSIFTMGSCFAEEIRIALFKKGFNLYPKYDRMSFDKNRVKIDELPERPHLNFYNTFTVLQELRRSFGELIFKHDDFFVIKDRFWKTEDQIYQDPYKRLSFGKTIEELRMALHNVNLEIDNGIKNSNVFVFTFGMTEVFKNKKNGLIVSQKPLYGGYGNLNDTTLHQSTFEENITNVQTIVDLIQSKKRGEAKIFLSVSPVPLNRTFSGDDVYIANLESKSLLRAALSEVARKNKNTFYFPSYDYITAFGRDAFEADGRHVKRPAVELIMEIFTHCYLSD